MTDPFRKTYQPLSDAQKILISDAKDQAGELLEIIEKVEKQHDVRSARLAKTKLEESVMWLVKAITWVPDNG